MRTFSDMQLISHCPKTLQLVTSEELYRIQQEVDRTLCDHIETLIDFARLENIYFVHAILEELEKFKHFGALDHLVVDFIVDPVLKGAIQGVAKCLYSEIDEQKARQLMRPCLEQARLNALDGQDLIVILRECTLRLLKLTQKKLLAGIHYCQRAEVYTQLHPSETEYEFRLPMRRLPLISLLSRLVSINENPQQFSFTRPQPQQVPSQLLTTLANRQRPPMLQAANRPIQTTQIVNAPPTIPALRSIQTPRHMNGESTYRPLPVATNEMTLFHQPERPLERVETNYSLPDSPTL